MNNQERVVRYARTRSRTRMLDVDLNASPPCESQSQEVSSDHIWSEQRQNAQEVNASVPTTIDLEALEDDDVIISSARAFAEAKNNARRNHRRNVIVDVDSEDRSSRNKRRRIPADQTIINCDLYGNEEGSGNTKKNSIHGDKSLSPPVPKEYTYDCPICMDTMVDIVSTKCGHIYCRRCIKLAIAAQSKCPTCRKKITARDIHKVYMPVPKF